VSVIRIVAAVVLDDDGRLLVVRKRGTTVFIQPGGKVEPGETPAEALVREVREELGAGVLTVREIGHREAPAANEPGHTVEADLFLVELDAPPRVCAEIDELAWVDPHAPGDVELAPLTVGAVLDWVRAQAN
jgi:8-oxo-dGTP pyrophosphatase MutT (NUDIX family)